MLTVQQATRLVLENTLPLPEETVPFHLAGGRILRETLLADRNFPPFDRVTMDGISLRYAAFHGGQRNFFIENVQAAGAPQLVLQNEKNCLEVMTGAMLPAGTDTVIRYEDLHLAEGQASVQIEAVQPGQNIHRQTSDRQAGSVLVKAGALLSPAEIGVAATVGKAVLRVSALPRVAVVSTGDELVSIGDTPLPHEIRRSNSYTMAAVLLRHGIQADVFHWPDQPEAIETGLLECLGGYDALLLSGGVSMGKFDYLPQIFEKTGVRKLFHQVSQRPGKPFWFGRTETTVLFAFPGNPVSTFMCLHRYFLPWLRATLGIPAFDARYAVLAGDFTFRPDLTYFLQVKLSHSEGGVTLATPITGQGSGDHANLTDSDAFLELPKDQDNFKKGEAFPVWIFR